MPMYAPFFGFFGHHRNESGKNRKLRIRCWVVLLSLAEPAARQLSTVIPETCASLAVSSARQAYIQEVVKARICSDCARVSFKNV